MDKILVVSPHQDDFIIGCGGILLKNKKAYKGVVFFYKVDEVKETKLSASILKVREQFFLGIKSRAITFDQKYLFMLVKLFREFKPDYLFIGGDDGDRDHRICFEICMEAAWLAEMPCLSELGRSHEVKGIFSYEIWSEIRKPQVLENIDKEIQKKIEAIKIHKSQLKSFAYDDFILSRNRIYGLLKGCRYAEAFSVIKTRL